MDYDIFREELAAKYPAYGHALWEPSPGGRYTAVEIGDVGFIREGYFHRLFNILLPEDHPSHQDGVPQRHEPLVLRMSSPTSIGTLQPNDFRSNGVLDKSDESGRWASGPDEAEQHSFSCSRRRGAILSLPVPAQRKDTAARGDFAKYITKHINEWFAFTQERGLGIGREDIILVTGCHLTRTWATMAFQEREEQVSFGVQVHGVSDVSWQFTRKGAKGVAYNLGPSGQNLPENQCIFVRGFRVILFSKILPFLRGAAGPARLPGEDDPDPDPQLNSIPTETHYREPLHTLMEYIATQASDCDMALVHDDDLRYIGNASLESLRPDTVMSHLRKSAPEIWHLPCGEDWSISSHRDMGASKTGAPPSKAVTKVATLSKHAFGEPSYTSATPAARPFVPFPTWLHETTPSSPSTYSRSESDSTLVESTQYPYLFPPPLTGYQYVQPIAQPFSTIILPGLVAPEQPSAKYECQYCGKCFIRPSSLKIHVHSHTVDRPFRCTFEGCNRAFSVQSNMRRHARTHLPKLEELESEGEEESEEEGVSNTQIPQPRVSPADPAGHHRGTGLLDPHTTGEKYLTSDEDIPQAADASTSTRYEAVQGNNVTTSGALGVPTTSASSPTTSASSLEDAS